MCTASILWMLGVRAPLLFLAEIRQKLQSLATRSNHPQDSPLALALVDEVRDFSAADASFLRDVATSYIGSSEKNSPLEQGRRRCHLQGSGALVTAPSPMVVLAAAGACASILVDRDAARNRWHAGASARTRALYGRHRRSFGLASCFPKQSSCPGNVAAAMVAHKEIVSSRVRSFSDLCFR